MQKQNSVALIVETSINYGRQLLQGILRFKKTQSNWSVLLEQRDLRAGSPEWLREWDGDGIISRSTTPEVVDLIRARKIPFVELTDRGTEEHEFVTLRSDDGSIGRLGAEHLMERGFRSFGFCGFEVEAWSERRETSFVERLSRGQLSCAVLNSQWYGTQNNNGSARSLASQQMRLKEWIDSLPKPVGIMACNDVRGKQVLDCCLANGIAVPEHVAVLRGRS